MRDLTLARVDAAILKSLHIRFGNMSPAELGATTIRCQFSDIRAVYFDAMKAAERVLDGHIPSDVGWVGNDLQRSTIGATVKRLRKEMKANG